MVICREQSANSFVCGPADATATPSSLAPVKSRMVYLSGASLPRLSWKRAVKTDVVVVRQGGKGQGRKCEREGKDRGWEEKSGENMEENRRGGKEGQGKGVEGRKGKGR